MTQSYSDYLHSPLWARIRGGVFARDKIKCQCCFQAAKCVHHRRYTTEVMEGRSDCLHWLISLCNDCHEYVEFSDDGAKIRDCTQKDIRLRARMLKLCGIKLDSWEKQARRHSSTSSKKQKKQKRKGRRQERVQSAAATPSPHPKKTTHDLARESESLRYDVDALKRKVYTLEAQLAVAIDALRELADQQCDVDSGPELMRLWNG